MKYKIHCVILISVLCGCKSSPCDTGLHQFNVASDTKLVKLQEGDSDMEIFIKFVEAYDEDICYQDLVFGLQISSDTIKSNFYFFCPKKSSPILPKAELRILVNQQGKAIINDDAVISIDSIDHWIADNLPIATDGNSFKKEIELTWNPHAKMKDFELAAFEIINGFQLKSKRIAKHEFNKTICELNPLESQTVLNLFPYKFAFKINHWPPPPDPPAPPSPSPNFK